MKNSLLTVADIQAIASAVIAKLKIELEPIVIMAKQVQEQQKMEEKANQVAQELKVIFDAIPDETKQALGVTGFCADPKRVWFKIARSNGTTISVKKLDDGFRVRVRNDGGELLKEVNPKLNGLNSLLAEMAKE